MFVQIFLQDMISILLDMYARVELLRAECQRIDAFELWFQPVHPKGDQSWVFIGRNDVEAETPILWLPDVKS